MRTTIALTLLLASGTAFADAKKEAKVHLEKATAAHKAARYEEALTELKIAYTLDPQPALLYAIGQVHVMQGQCDQAITFYERFIAAHPSPEQAAKASQAIETCKKLAPEKPVDPVNPVIQPQQPVEPLIIEKPVTVITTTRPWYTDVVGDVLVGTGIISGIVGLVFYRGALSTRDEADTVMSYERYDELVADADSKQTLSIVFAASGAALVTAGIISYVVRDRSVESRTVSVVPTSQGGLVTWFARF